MPTGGQLQKVQPLDVGDLDAGDVTEGLNGLRTFGSVHHKWSPARDVAAVTHFSLAGTNAAAVFSLFGVRECSDLLEDFDRFFCLLDSFGGVADDKGELRDRLDAVAAGEDEGRNGGGSNGGDDGVALLVHVDLPMPAAPDLGRGEHASAAAHVSKGSLAGAVGSAAGNTGDTGDGSAGTPGFGGGLVTSATTDGVWLAAVLGDVRVYEIDDVGADRGLHDVRDGNGGGGIGCHVTVEGLHGDERACCGGHCCEKGRKSSLPRVFGVGLSDGLS